MTAPAAPWSREAAACCPRAWSRCAAAVIGAPVHRLDGDGRVIAAGLSNYASTDIERIKGRRTGEIAAILGCKDSDEIIHRDNLVIMGRDAGINHRFTNRAHPGIVARAWQARQSRRPGRTDNHPAGESRWNAPR